MVDLTSPYPFGINRSNWPMFAIGLLFLLDLMLFSDHTVSLLATKQTPDVINFFNQVTRWGESDWILIPSGALLIISAIFARLLPQRISKLALIEMIQIYALIFVGVGLPGLVADIVKHVVGRSRPVVFDQAGILGFHPLINDFGYQSWPFLGHTTTAFALAMVIGFLSPKWFGFGLLYAFAVGASRLVLGRPLSDGRAVGRRPGFASAPMPCEIFSPAAAGASSDAPTGTSCNGRSLGFRGWPGAFSASRRDSARDRRRDRP